MASFRVYIQKANSGDLYELTPKSVKFTERINEERRAEFDFIYRNFQDRADTYGTTVLSMLTSERTEIWITRNGTKIFLGAITRVYIDPNFKTDLVLKIVAVDYFGLLAKRICGVPSVTYSATDAGAIAWDLIDDSQNSDTPYSDWDITQGDIDTSVNRDRTYRFEKISEVIYRLSSDNIINGFDFEIDADKQFNVYYPSKGQSLPNLLFNTKNVADWSWEYPLMLEMTNKVHVLGQGFNDDVEYVTRNAANSYKTPFGLLEAIQPERDVILTSTLEGKGDRLLEQERESDIEFTLSHYDAVIGWNEYELGDTVVVDFPHLGLTRATKRVVERKFKWDEDEVMIDVKFE